MRKIDCLLFVLITIILVGCKNKNIYQEVKFNNISIKKSTNIDNDTSSPQCKVDILLMYANNNSKNIDNKINNAIIDKIFAMQRLNAKTAVDSFANKYLNDYKNNFGPFYKEDKENPDKRHMYEFFYILKSEVKTGKNGIVNYLLNENFYEGGAHNIKQTIVMNFDNTTGQLITIKDVFVPGYESKLNDILLNALLKKTETKDIDALKAKGFFVSSDIFAPENFILGEDGITFIYNDYEIAPYNIGKTEITIKYNKLDNILNKKWM